MFIAFLIAAQITAEAPNPSSATVPSFEQGKPLDDAALGNATAREDIEQIATSTQVAGVSSSSVSGNVRTGAANFTDNAFQNLSGLAVINANTGNNVAINGAITVNVVIAPR